MTKRAELAGRIFGRWTVISHAGGGHCCDFSEADWALCAAREEYDAANSQFGVGA